MEAVDLKVIRKVHFDKFITPGKYDHTRTFHISSKHYIRISQLVCYTKTALK